MSLSNLITLIGGLGMFIYGMTIMGEGLEKAAGDRLQSIIDKTTGNIFKGVLMGALVTALIQSSSATTVMTVGFVNAGIMTLKQSVGVIMGANIGTTITAWIISIGDLTGTSALFEMIKPKNFAPILLALGVVLFVFMGKKKKLSITGEIFVGFGLLFVGMYTMENAVAALRELPAFESAFVSFQNPVIGVLVGAGITALIQSSSASVGILQASAAAGLVTFSSAVPIIMGQNIGTCVTALISSAGASKNAKKTAIIHLSFNVVGTVIIMTVIYILQHTVGIYFWNAVMDRTSIAVFHTIFNITNTIILLPMSGLLVKIADLVIRGGDEEKVTKHIDKRLITTPVLALAQSSKELTDMAEIARENVKLTHKMFQTRNTALFEKIEENEKRIDTLEYEMNRYLSAIVENPLSSYENNTITSMFHIINDVERIGDHAMNIAEILNYTISNKLEFSDSAKAEIEKMYVCLFKILDLTISSYQTLDLSQAIKIEPLEEVIDELSDRLRNRHVKRLTTQQCSVQSGLKFLDLITNFERISDHCSNIGISVIQQCDKSVVGDAHEYAKNLHEGQEEDYNEIYERYLKRYNV